MFLYLNFSYMYVEFKLVELMATIDFRIEILIRRARYSNHEYIYFFLFNPVVPFRKHRVKLVSLPERLILRGIPFVGVMSYQ